jgi:protein-disulfide isomerase
MTANPADGSTIDAKRMTKFGWRNALDTVAAVGMIVAAALLIRTYWPTSGPETTKPAVPPEQVVDIGSDWVQGAPNADLHLILYSDFECPVCGRFARELWPSIRKTFVAPGRVALAFRHLANEARHAHALAAAVMAECAGEQGRFWEMHDLIFANQAALDQADLRRHAQLLGLDMKQVDSCLLGTAPAKVRRQTNEARELEVSGSPTFFVAGRQPDGRYLVTGKLNGIRSLPEFSRLIESFLSSSSPMPSQRGR